MLDLVACPDPSCHQPADVQDRLIMESTSGPVEHVKIHCLSRHNFFMPAASLSPL
jgi:hypothetical protein